MEPALKICDILISHIANYDRISKTLLSAAAEERVMLLSQPLNEQMAAD